MRIMLRTRSARGNEQAKPNLEVHALHSFPGGTIEINGTLTRDEHDRLMALIREIIWARVPADGWASERDGWIVSCGSVSPVAAFGNWTGKATQ